MRNLLYGLILFGVLGCGVKGQPLPPLTAPPIGRGQPTMAQPEDEADPVPTKKKSQTRDSR